MPPRKKVSVIARLENSGHRCTEKPLANSYLARGFYLVWRRSRRNASGGVKKSPPILGGVEARKSFGGGKGRLQT